MENKKPDMKSEEISNAMEKLNKQIEANAPMIAQAKQALSMLDKLSSFTGGALTNPQFNMDGMDGMLNQLKEDHPPSRLTLEDAMAQNNYTIDEILVFICGLKGKDQETIAYRLKHLTGVQ